MVESFCFLQLLKSLALFVALPFLAKITYISYSIIYHSSSLIYTAYRRSYALWLFDQKYLYL